MQDKLELLRNLLELKKAGIFSDEEIQVATDKILAGRDLTSSIEPDRRDQDKHTEDASVSTNEANAETNLDQNQCGKKLNESKRNKGMGCAYLLVAIAVIAFFSSLGENNKQKTTEKRTGSHSSSPYKNLSPIEKMEIAFVGNYSQGQITKLLQPTMQLFENSLNNDNYEKWGNVLVALRKERDVPEMDILRCMRAMALSMGAVKIKFHEAAALCVSTLAE